MMMKIYVESLMGNRWTISDLTTDATIAMLQRLIWQKCGINPGNQALSHRGVLLEPNRTVAECGVADRAVLQLTLRPQTGWWQL
jgi:hypothetical protein